MGLRRKGEAVAPFEDRDVKAVGIEIPNAGGGLSEALTIDPVELHHGETIYVVIECEVRKIRHDSILEKGEPTDDLKRVHILKAGRSTLIDAELVKPAIDEQHARVNAAREAAKGQDELDGLGVDD